ncbi:thiol reductant ABC exporter subunit CydC [Anaerobacillus sp. CMMVII]|uniref:thiol reductant ABC exporter subunit CydC n=1 Tax=Anaerobacillus sp. CMMVII TaxID=2755588 RepID=UPI0021B772CA|nr:thiol reductant ABC exporter subunit CydC [Anaerobacillus sp. CMMVII]MCT8139455.1 thiol reductant ABC exporter subunit CydC [Anaerobacillus sp. CMMVII]
MKELFTLTKIMMSEKKAIFLAILLGFIASISSVGLIGTGGYLISQSALHPPLYTLTLTILFVRFFGLSRAASRYAERYFSHKATFTILGKLRVYFYDKIEPLAPALFATYRSGDLLSRVVADVDRLQYFFLRVFYPPLVMIVVFITTGVVIYTFSIAMALVLLGGVLIVGIAIPLFFTFFTQNIGLQLREKRSQLSVTITDFLYGFNDLRTNQRLKDKLTDINQISRDLVAEQEKDGMLSSKGESISGLMTFLTAWMMLIVGVTLVDAGQLNGVFLAMLVLITLTVFETATPMAIIPGHIEESRVASERLFKLTNNQNEQKGRSTEKIDVPTAPVKITVDRVSFAYPSEERFALKNIQLLIEEKKKVAIVGASGSGKSSFLQLLLKFYDNYRGDIWLGDWNLKDLSEEDARCFFGVVAQENHFFNQTIRANLLLAKPEATDEELEEILKSVALPHIKLNDVLSEKGTSLSGGERQRLAIARMVLKDSPIWLLDEPTTGLDALTEQEVLSVLWPKVEGKTVVYITHKLVGLEKMDEIIVFDKGTIIEQGSYEALLKNKGYFYDLKQLEVEKIS